MTIWGKYIANSIINGYLTGMYFAIPFVKIIYDEPVSYRDLLEISTKGEI
jgi:hypothetical protein